MRQPVLAKLLSSKSPVPPQVPHGVPTTPGSRPRVYLDQVMKNPMGENMVELNDLEQHQIKEIFDTFSDWEVIMNGEEFDLGGGPS